MSFFGCCGSDDNDKDAVAGSDMDAKQQSEDVGAGTDALESEPAGAASGAVAAAVAAVESSSSPAQSNAKLVNMDEIDIRDATTNQSIKIKAEKISLKVHSCRVAFDPSTKPANLMDADRELYYKSEINSGFRYDNFFKRTEADWIVFQMEDPWFNFSGKRWIPVAFKIRNKQAAEPSAVDESKNNNNNIESNVSSAVASVRVSVGEVRKDGFHWSPLNSEPIPIAREHPTDLQSCVLDKMNMERPRLGFMIKKNKWKYIKLEFVDNHGLKAADQSRFVCAEFQLYGYLG